jgi:hypothetical protein
MFIKVRRESGRCVQLCLGDVKSLMCLSLKATVRCARGNSCQVTPLFVVMAESASAAARHMVWYAGSTGLLRDDALAYRKHVATNDSVLLNAVYGCMLQFVAGALHGQPAW